jgi:hypothetical protein
MSNQLLIICPQGHLDFDVGYCNIAEVTKFTLDKGGASLAHDPEATSAFVYGCMITELIRLKNAALSREPNPSDMDRINSNMQQIVNNAVQEAAKVKQDYKPKFI